MGDIDKVEFLEQNLSRQLSWIGAADAKTSFAFAVNTAMLGLVAAIAPNSICSWANMSAIFTAIAVFLGFLSLLFLSLATFPRKDGPKGSMIYFGGLAKRECKEFKEDLESLTVKSYVDDLSSQCHRNAEIAERKFVWIRRAMVSLYLSVLPWVVAVYLLYNGAQ